MKARRWFQVHLLTVMVMMFIASAFLYLNTRPTETDNVNVRTLARTSSRKYIYFDREQTTRFGWPFQVKQVHWTNATPVGERMQESEYESIVQSAGGIRENPSVTAHYTWEEFKIAATKITRSSEFVIERLSIDGTAQIVDEGEWSLEGVLYNVFIVAGILVLAVIACERFIRRREVKYIV